jgi:N-hydroxyarylamine O-acetyltransferase
MTSSATEPVQSYLERIDHARPPAATVEALRSLQRAHLRAVPFENLDIHLGRPIVLEIDPILAKVVGRRRGGFCYELNGAFATLLSSLGFDVSLLEARVYAGDAVGIPFDHLCLLVTIDGQRHLADVGFGAFCDEPIDFDDRGEQTDPAGMFQIADRPDGWIDVSMNGALSYRLSPRPRALADFEPGCTHHQTSPDSHFTQGTVCSLRTPDGRITLSGTTLIETIGGERRTTDVEANDIGPILADRFGIALPADDLAKLG